MHRVFLIVPAQALVARYIESFKEFPPRAKAASFTVSDVMENPGGKSRREQWLGHNKMHSFGRLAIFL
jgi:hypothetical protein